MSKRLISVILFVIQIAITGTLFILPAEAKSWIIAGEVLVSIVGITIIVIFWRRLEKLQTANLEVQFEAHERLKWWYVLVVVSIIVTFTILGDLLT